jgi:hypothetical protein
MSRKFPKRKLAGLIAVIAVSGFVLFNWQSLLFASAVAASDKRPALLRDAEWDKPETALAFRGRFRRGSSEASLMQWMKANNFKIDQQARRASLKVGGLPCAEAVAVSWTVIDGSIGATEAVVSEAGCL